MDIRLDYGKTGLAVTFPDDADVTVVEPQFVEGVADQAEAVRAAVRAPIGSPPLREIVKPRDTVGIIFYVWKKLPYSHAIWHVFVLGGSMCHYFAVLFYLLPVA